jgi:hypothetical protein
MVEIPQDEQSLTIRVAGEGQPYEEPISTDSHPQAPLPDQPLPLPQPPPGDILQILDASYTVITKGMFSTFLSYKGDDFFYIIVPYAWERPPLIQISQSMVGELLAFLRV